MTKIFISYSRKDLTFVEKLTSDLRRARFEVWYDLSNLEGGERWRIEIQNAIRDSQYTIVVLSPDSVESEWVDREFLFSSNLKRKIIPLLYRKCELPLNYVDLNYIDVQGENYQQNFDKILKVLDTEAAKLDASAVTANRALEITSVKKLPNPRKNRIGAGIIGAFFSIALIAGAIYFLLGKGKSDQTSTAPSGIDQQYLFLGGEGGLLGAPVGPEHSTQDGQGRYREFQGGSIYWSLTTGAHEVHGDIRDKWKAVGSESSFLGYPVTDETATPDGIGRFSDFQGGSIYWSPDTGAREIHGDIRDKWKAIGSESSFLGYPRTDQSIATDGIGQFIHFQGGSIYWSPDTGAHEVHGDIRDKWEALGLEQSFLGYPRTDQTTTPDGIGQFIHFQGGSIYWSPDTGAHEVHGDIRDKWESLGWETSFLGYPVTDETATPDGIGRFNDFQGGSIYWTPDTGSHEIHGAIHDRWEALGSETSCLGYPISDEEPASGDWSRQSRFEHGVIRWTSEQGAVEFCY